MIGIADSDEFELYTWITTKKPSENDFLRNEYFSRKIFHFLSNIQENLLDDTLEMVRNNIIFKITDKYSNSILSSSQ